MFVFFVVFLSNNNYLSATLNGDCVDRRVRVGWIKKMSRQRDARAGDKTKIQHGNKKKRTRRLQKIPSGHENL